jgi:hypothetical protein
MTWILWLMLVVNGEPVHSSLSQYPTLEKCQIAQVYVEAEMHKSYPDDRELRVYCEPRGTLARHKNGIKRGKGYRVALTKEM